MRIIIMNVLISNSMPAYIQVMEMRYSDNAHAWPTRLKPVTLLQTGILVVVVVVVNTLLNALEVVYRSTRLGSLHAWLCWSKLFYHTYIFVFLPSHCPLALEMTCICDHLHHCCIGVEGVMSTLILPAFRLQGKNYTTSGKKGKKMLRENLWEKPQKSMCMLNV